LVSELIVSHHCALRFRTRLRLRAPAPELETVLRAALESADITSWRPTWIDSDYDTELWALTETLAFPLRATSERGRWLALTCLVRPPPH
jgi:hypothetical protein